MGVAIGQGCAMSRMTGCLAAAIIALAMSPAGAAITPQAYRDVGVSLPADAAVPPGAMTRDEHGRLFDLAASISRPSVLVFADYTCTTLCGPIVAFAAGALEKSGLAPGIDFRLIVVGLDPKDTAADAARMRSDHLGGNVALGAATTFVTANQATVSRLAAALGYRYAYDEEHDQYVHPGAAYVLRADGRVSQVLTGLGLSPADMRLALVEAGEGRVGTIGDQVRLLCSGFDPAHGTYNLLVSRVLAATGLATILAIVGGIGLLILAGRRRAA
jgi:protein SCO1